MLPFAKMKDVCADFHCITAPLSLQASLFSLNLGESNSVWIFSRWIWLTQQKNWVVFWEGLQTVWKTPENWDHLTWRRISLWTGCHPTWDVTLILWLQVGFEVLKTGWYDGRPVANSASGLWYFVVGKDYCLASPLCCAGLWVCICTPPLVNSPCLTEEVTHLS